MTIAETVTLGAVQGLTEFLPVSSSAHLVFAQSLMRVPERLALPLDVFLHLGTLAAAVWAFRSDIARLVRAVLFPPAGGDAAGRRLFLALVVATIPAAVAGALLNGLVEHAFASPHAAALFLMITGIVLLSTRFARAARRPVDLPRALVVGVAQAIAILPGISRSGSTISTAIWLGVERREAARFSFLLSIPVILGAAALEVPGLAHAPDLPPPAALAAGLVASLVTGLIAIQVVLRVVGRGRFELFGLDCLLAGAAALVVL